MQTSQVDLDLMQEDKELRYKIAGVYKAVERPVTILYPVTN
jgi:hypothetical protein